MRFTLVFLPPSPNFSIVYSIQCRNICYRLLSAIKYSQSAIQQAAYYLLKQPAILDQIQEDIYFDVDDIWRTHDEIPTRITIALDAVSPSRKIVLYNALVFRRHEVLTVLVSSPHVEVSKICNHRKHKYNIKYPISNVSLSICLECL